MNIVLDDAVEVKQITKSNDKETRRNLGTSLSSLPRLIADFIQGKSY